MLGVVDSGNNYIYEVHQYLDSDHSGTHDTCISSTVGVESLQAFDGWLQQNNKQAFLGEFGGGPNQTCLSAMDGMLTFVESNPSRWLGWAYWAGGPWWSTSSDLVITDSQTPPQLTLLESHL